MSKDRDIDDILDSLNQLLREGESHNDDHVESEGAEVDEEVLLSEPEQEASGSDDVEEAHVDAEVAAEVAGHPDGADEANVEAQIEGAIEEGSAEASATLPITQQHSNDDSEPVADDQESVTVQRVVLTEDMLIDNPQGSLLSLVQDSMANVDSGDDADALHETDRENRLTLDQKLMTELMEHVADDVIQALQQQLPLLIQNSLEKHLNELKKSENPDNAPEQTEE
jgi:hypothetical protein